MSIIKLLFRGVFQAINGGKNVLEPVEGISFEDRAKKIAFDPFGKDAQMNKLIMEYRDKYE